MSRIEDIYEELSGYEEYRQQKNAQEDKRIRAKGRSQWHLFMGLGIAVAAFAVGAPPAIVGVLLASAIALSLWF